MHSDTADKEWAGCDLFCSAVIHRSEARTKLPDLAESGKLSPAGRLTAPGSGHAAEHSCCLSSRQLLSQASRLLPSGAASIHSAQSVGRILAMAAQRLTFVDACHTRLVQASGREASRRDSAAR